MIEDPHSDADPDDLNAEDSLLLHPSDNGQSKTTIGRSTGKRSLSERRQSSLSIPPQDGLARTPRTTNRVRFEVGQQDSSEHAPNRRVRSPTPRIEEEEYFSHDGSADGRTSTSQRAPLLTGIEAPSVTVASTGLDFNVEDLLESSRPKSGMRSAFMNMANSIIGAGIIGMQHLHPSVSPDILKVTFKDNRTLFDRPA